MTYFDPVKIDNCNQYLTNIRQDEQALCDRLRHTNISDA